MIGNGKEIGVEVLSDSLVEDMSYFQGELDEDNTINWINPEIIEKSGTEISEEGCLSVPEYYAEVERAEKVTVRALGRDGETYEIDADGLLAVCIQHEMDHLQGKLFVDYLSPLKQQRVRKKLEKLAKQGAL